MAYDGKVTYIPGVHAVLRSAVICGAGNALSINIVHNQDNAATDSNRERVSQTGIDVFVHLLTMHEFNCVNY